MVSKLGFKVIICFHNNDVGSRYYVWYMQMGDLETAEKHLVAELLGWEKKYNKPMVMTEYGTDTLADLHSLQDQLWSGEF